MAKTLAQNLDAVRARIIDAGGRGHVETEIALVHLDVAASTAADMLATLREFDALLGRNGGPGPVMRYRETLKAVIAKAEGQS